jgi:hypothetical protein
MLIPGVSLALLSEARIITAPTARKQRGTVIIISSFLVLLWD